MKYIAIILLFALWAVFTLLFLCSVIGFFLIHPIISESDWWIDMPSQILSLKDN